MNYASNAFAFLIHALFSLYILCVMLRVLLQAVRADFYNPICQFLVKATNPPLLPLRRFIPGFGGVDVAGIVLLFILQLLELLIVSWIIGPVLTFPGILLLVIAELLTFLGWVYIIAIIIMALLSWFSPDPANPAVPLLWRLTAPVIAPIRNIMPDMGGIDLSPLVAILLIQFTMLLILAPFSDFALSLALAGF